METIKSKTTSLHADLMLDPDDPKGLAHQVMGLFLNEIEYICDGLYELGADMSEVKSRLADGLTEIAGLLSGMLEMPKQTFMDKASHDFDRGKLRRAIFNVEQDNDNQED